jgi:hypothetical protein
VGWMYGRECKQEQWRYNEKTWYVPVENLRNIETLKDAITV